MSKIKDAFFTDKEAENFYEIFGEREDEEQRDKRIIRGNEQGTGRNDGGQERLGEPVF